MINKEKIKVYGATWCPDTKNAIEFLRSKNIDFEFIDIDKDKEAEDFVLKTNTDGTRTIPVIVKTNGEVLINPLDIKLLINE